MPQPMILFPYKRIPAILGESIPDGFSMGKSENGWMTSETFYEYVANVFYPWCLKKEVKFPIILYVDGHVSHLTMALSDFCIAHDIELIALYPNATHLLQPMDVSLFRPLKAAWRNTVSEWRMQNSGLAMKKHNFALLLKKALDSIDTVNILKNGFRACGLCPFSPNAVDYNKLINKTDNDKSNEKENEENISPLEEQSLKFIEKNINANTLVDFELCKDSEIWAGVEKDKSLFYLWLKLKKKEFSKSRKNNSKSCFIQLF